MPNSSSFYGVARPPRLQLKTFGEVEAAAAAGLLAETAWVELKADIPASSKGANTELAKDLASLSIDGGLLFIGVDDHEKVLGLDGDQGPLVTRVIQVSATRINPPLFVDVSVLEADADAETDLQGKSVVIVHVPASGSAPHMVDDQYWGRSSEGKRALGDSEVVRLMSERRLRRTYLDAELRGVEATLDPNLGHTHSHLSFMAVPRAAANGPLSMVIPDHRVLTEVTGALDFEAAWPPWSSLGHHHAFHPDGYVFSSDDPRFGLFAPEDRAYRMLLKDDGSVSAVAGGVTMAMETRNGVEEAVMCGYLLEGVHSLVRLAGYMAGTHLDYWGEWDLGVAVSDLRGRSATDRLHSGSLEIQIFPADDFTRSTNGTTREMIEQPSAVVARLLGPLLRALGVERLWLPYTEGSEICARSKARR